MAMAPFISLETRIARAYEGLKVARRDGSAARIISAAERVDGLLDELLEGGQ